MQMIPLIIGKCFVLLSTMTTARRIRFLAGPTPTQYTLASGLVDGVHKMVLMKETYWWYNSVLHESGSRRAPG